MFTAILQSHKFQRDHRPVATFAGTSASVDHGQLDVLENVQFGQQIEKLKNKADFPVADMGQLSWRCILYHHAIELDRSLRRGIQTTQNVHQRRFAAARRPDNRHKLATLNVEGHVVQRPDFLPAQVVNLADLSKLQ